MQLTSAHDRFVELHASVVFISADGPETSAELAAELEIPFPVLSDSPRRVISAYGVADRSSEIAVPAVFVVSRDGQVTWSHVGENPADSPTIDDIIAVVARL